MNVLLDALAVLEAQREAELRLAVPAREMRQVSVRDVHSMPYYAQHTPCSATGLSPLRRRLGVPLGRRAHVPHLTGEYSSTQRVGEPHTCDSMLLAYGCARA